MKILIVPHTLKRAMELGPSGYEIKNFLHPCFDIPAKRHRRGKAKVYNYNQKRLNTFYKQKKIEVIYTIKDDTIVTIIVYVYYGRWKEQQ